MKIICAGFPKTGTKSMALALRQLGYSVHDYPEHIEYNLDAYLDFFGGKVGPEIFLDLYSSVDVVIDQPTSVLWDILLRQFPDAKVILMERNNAEDWYKSYSSMIEYFRIHIRPCSNFCKEVWINRYTTHNAAVRALVPSHNLLVCELGEGWERLCEFLNKPVPNLPWPHKNKSGTKDYLPLQYANYPKVQKSNTEVTQTILVLISGIVLISGFVYKTKC